MHVLHHVNNLNITGSSFSTRCFHAVRPSERSQHNALGLEKGDFRHKGNFDVKMCTISAGHTRGYMNIRGCTDASRAEKKVSHNLYPVTVMEAPIEPSFK